MDVMAETPTALRASVRRMGDEGMASTYEPGKWTASQILCHMTDCEIAFSFRIRQAFVQSPHLIQPFDQEAWAKSYDSLDPYLALETFTGLRNWNVALLQARAADIASRTVSHPERGDMTLQGMLEIIAGHDINHRKQLETIAAAAA